MDAPFATLVVGMMVAGVAFQQWIVSRHKLRLDLFDRRYKVYDATRKFVSALVANGRLQQQDLLDFYTDTADAEFLFQKDVVGYLEQIKNRAIDIRMHGEIVEAFPPGPERSKNLQAAHEHTAWLGEQLKGMRAVFSPYLSFSNI